MDTASVIKKRNFLPSNRMTFKNLMIFFLSRSESITIQLMENKCCRAYIGTKRKKKKKRTYKVNNAIRLKYSSVYSIHLQHTYEYFMNTILLFFFVFFFFWVIVSAVLYAHFWFVFCFASIARCQQKKIIIKSANTFETSGGTHICIWVNSAENFMRTNGIRSNRLFVKLKQSFIPAAPSEHTVFYYCFLFIRWLCKYKIEWASAYFSLLLSIVHSQELCCVSIIIHMESWKRLSKTKQIKTEKKNWTNETTKSKNLCKSHIGFVD